MNLKGYPAGATVPADRAHPFSGGSGVQDLCVGHDEGREIVSVTVRQPCASVLGRSVLLLRAVPGTLDELTQARQALVGFVRFPETGNVYSDSGSRLLVANAGIINWSSFWEIPDEQWQTTIDNNLTGVFNTLKAATPIMIDQGRSGSIVFTRSVAGIEALPAQAHYSAAKHGVVGLMRLPPSTRTLRHSGHPWGVDTPMAAMTPDITKILADNPNYGASFNQLLNDPPIATPRDISEAVLFLSSPASRRVAGI